jgi:hypothetical protein
LTKQSEHLKPIYEIGKIFFLPKLEKMLGTSFSYMYAESGLRHNNVAAVNNALERYMVFSKQLLSMSILRFCGTSLMLIST